MKMFCILIVVVVVLWLYKFIKVHRNEDLKFTECKLYSSQPAKKKLGDKMVLVIPLVWVANKDFLKKATFNV